MRKYQINILLICIAFIIICTTKDKYKCIITILFSTFLLGISDCSFFKKWKRHFYSSLHPSKGNPFDVQSDLKRGKREGFEFREDEDPSFFIKAPRIVMLQIY